MSTKKKTVDDVLEKEYLGDLHHDLKNQITSIKAFNQLIARKSNDKDIKEYTDFIEERSEKLLEMINNFFDSIRGKK